MKYCKNRHKPFTHLFSSQLDAAYSHNLCKDIAFLEPDKKYVNFIGYTALYQNTSVSSCLFSYLLYYVYTIILYVVFLLYVFQDHEVNFQMKIYFLDGGTKEVNFSWMFCKR